MSEKLAGDEHMGRFVYCKQHVGPHSTGWCTVSASDKIPLQAETLGEAYAEVEAMGLKIFEG